MEQLTSYLFKYCGWTWLNRTGEIGNFNDSSWSFSFHNECACEGFNLKITRSHALKSFAIISSFSILYENSHHQKECYLKCIADGETYVDFPFVIRFTDQISAGVVEFLGSITIIQLSASCSKEPQVSVGSLTECIPNSVDDFKPSPHPELTKDLLRMLNDPESFPDATLKCGAEEILVHKGILSARSPVFAAMFKNEMQEGSSGVAEIVDIEPNVLQATLKYVYGGKTDHLDDGIAGDVLFAANKYQLEELKKVCIDKLKASLTVDNVFHVLVLGDLHDEGLKMYAIDFFCKCDTFSNLEKTEGWKLLQSENPGLAMEVLMFTVKYAQKCLAKNIVSK